MNRRPGSAPVAQDARFERQGFVIADLDVGQSGLPRNSVTGSLAPRQNRSPRRPHPQYRFIYPGAHREWERSGAGLGWCASADWINMAVQHAVQLTIGPLV